jgi:hypothetical protein
MNSKVMGEPLADNEADRPNPHCKCRTVQDVLACATGHLLDCHHPQTCEQAKCSHWQLDHRTTLTTEVTEEQKS